MSSARGKSVLEETDCLDFKESGFDVFRATVAGIAIGDEVEVGASVASLCKSELSAMLSELRARSLL